MQEFIDRVLSGELVVSSFVRQAVDRHVWDLETGTERGLTFDSELAATVCDRWPKRYTHTRGAYRLQPFVLSPSQRFMIGSYFGWLRSDTGCRRFRHMYISCGRKFGKTMLAAALSLELGLFPYPHRTPEGQIVYAATKLEQAYLAMNQTAAILELMPESELTKFMKRGANFHQLILEAPPWNRTVFKPLAASATSGLDTSVVIVDELHEFESKAHKAFWSTLETSQGSGATRSPAFVVITTAGSDSSLIWQNYDAYACTVLNGYKRAVDDSMFCFIARLSEKTVTTEGEVPEDDIFDEKNWAKANPEVGHHPTYEFLRQQAAKAKEDPSFERDFRRYYCNMRVRSEFKPVNMQKWKLLERATPDEFAADGCGHCAFDLGTRDDLASLAVVWQDDELHYHCKQVSFCPADGKQDLSTFPWAEYVRRGELIPTEGDTTDINVLRDTLLEWESEYGFATVSADPWNARQILTDLINQHGINVEEFPQNARHYNEPIREFLRCISAGTFHHNGDKLLASAVDNLVLKPTPTDELRPDKETSPGKIDPIVSVLMAFARAIMSGVEGDATYYDDNQLEVM